MASDLLKVSVLFAATNHVSGVVKSITGDTKRLSKAMDAVRNASTLAVGAGSAGLAGVAAIVGSTASAYATLEEATLDLKSALRGADGGLPAAFDDISNQAEVLGNKLPGATQDFYKMAKVMRQQGLKPEDIAGLMKPAAYLGVALKMPYDEAAKGAIRLKQVTGVLDKDMGGFLDQLYRTTNLGVEFEEMQYAFSRSGDALKQVGIQGLEAIKGVTPAMSILVKELGSGEMAGTAFGDMIRTSLDAGKVAKVNQYLKQAGVQLKFADKSGKFLGVEKLVSQLEKLKGLSDVGKVKALSELFGTGGAARAAQTLLTSGNAGIAKQAELMRNQVGLVKTAEEGLGGLSALAEAVSGSWESFMAAIGSTFADDLKGVGNLINEVVGELIGFVKENKTLVKWMIYGAGALAALAAGFGTVTLGILGVGQVVGVIKQMQIVMWALGVFMRSSLIPTVWAFTTALFANPITWIVAGVVALVAAIGYLLHKFGLLDPALKFINELFSETIGKLKEFWEWTQNTAGTIGEFLSFGGSKQTGDISTPTSAANVSKIASKNTAGTIGEFLSFGGSKQTGDISTPTSAANVSKIASQSGDFGYKNAKNNIVSGGSVSVDYKPTINISGSMTEKERQNFKEMLEKHKEEIVRMVAGANSRKAQLAY